MLKDRALRKRDRGQELRRLNTAEGETLRVMRYRLPAVEYESSDCGPKPLRRVEADYVVLLLFQCVVQNDLFAAALDALDVDLGSQVVREREAGGNWQGFAGQRLRGLVYQFDRDGMLPVLLRVAGITRTADLERFVESYADGEQRGRMARYSRFVKCRRSDRDESALAAMFSGWGLRLGPDSRETLPDALKELAVLIVRTSGYFEDVGSDGSERTKKKGGCGECSN